MKRILCIFLTVILLVTVAAPAMTVSADSVTDESTIRGDADSDGEVTSRDATVIQRALLSLTVPKYNEKAADVDCDGTVTTVDAT